MKTITTLIAFAAVAIGYGDTTKGKGLIPLSKEERAHIKKSWQKVDKVHPNKVGAARIKIHHAKMGMEPPEFTTALNDTEEFSTPPGTPVSASSLPSQVDNSQLPWFPPIGDQGQEGSCLAWASTYYQATHETGLVNSRNNKNTINNVLSPKWTYNMINGGVDQGSSITDAYMLLSQNGATSIRSFPYDGSDFLSWDLNLQDWISALSNRLSTPKYIPGLNGTTQDLSQIKMALNNGHVLTFATFIDSWVTTTVGADPSGSNPFAGQLAASWMNGSNGGHMMTIVGYNDAIWIDVNGNGVVDPGELGAFLIANSWSSQWGNSGFVWVAYDAFLSKSAVQNGPSENRVPLADGSNSYAILATAKAPLYSPSLIAQFELSQTNRNQIRVAAGVSNASNPAPTNYFRSGALVNQGGAFDFQGQKKTKPESGTFCIDLTDIMSMGDKYYFMVVDNSTGDPTALNSLSLVDLVHGKSVSGTNLPQTVDNGKITQEIVYSFPQTAPLRMNMSRMRLSSPSHNQTLSDSVPLSFSTPKTLKKVEFYVDWKLVAVEETPPYHTMIDTTQLSNGSHRFSAIAYSKEGNSRTSQATATVKN